MILLKNNRKKFLNYYVIDANDRVLMVNKNPVVGLFFIKNKIYRHKLKLNFQITV